MTLSRTIRNEIVQFPTIFLSNRVLNNWRRPPSSIFSLIIYSIVAGPVSLPWTWYVTSSTFIPILLRLTATKKQNGRVVLETHAEYSFATKQNHYRRHCHWFFLDIFQNPLVHHNHLRGTKHLRSHDDVLQKTDENIENHIFNFNWNYLKNYSIQLTIN